MAKLKLFTAFHLNLAFSSIPKEQYALAIDRCYWPMIDILEEFDNVKFGIELTAYTLEKIKEVDYTFVQKLREISSSGKCEILGSGMSQAIFPLIPREVNIKNVEIGNKIYRDILGFVPETGYVNEQCYSDGIAESYYVNGYKNLIMDYDNANLFNKYPQEFKYKSNRTKAGEGELNLVWNNSIAFQKLQRYAFGQINLKEYLDYLYGQTDENEDRSFCIYGSDLEIFDYKPGNYDWFYNPKASIEIDRLHALFKFLNNSDKFEFTLPMEVAKENNTGEFISVSTPEYPIVCKKQPKYNVVRWAVSGLQNTKMNTDCSRICEDLKILSRFNKDSDEMWKNLSVLFASDYRTKTTESKRSEYYSLLGRTEALIEREQQDTRNSQRDKSLFQLVNTNSFDIEEGYIFECDIKFNQGEVFDRNYNLFLNNSLINFQFENMEYYRDGSIRKSTVLMELPEIAAGEKIYGEFKKTADFKNSRWSINDSTIETEKVKIEFSKIKKGTIENLVLKDISAVSILGNFRHGYFDDVRYSADLFSGHTILRENSLKQITDLDGSSIIYPNKADQFNIRIPVKSKIKGEFGELWKIYYIYLNQSRIDIEYNFRFQDICPIFFRTGILTINPEFFDIDSLNYKTNNGGKTEEYFLKNKEFNQTDMISLSVSSNGCIGATEEKLTLEDKDKKVVFQRDNSLLYTVPMIEYREIDGKYMMRLYHSLSETDDTGSIFWRGHGKVRMSISDKEDKLYNNGIFYIEKHDLQ